MPQKWFYLFHQLFHRRPDTLTQALLPVVNHYITVKHSLTKEDVTAIYFESVAAPTKPPVSPKKQSGLTANAVATLLGTRMNATAENADTTTADVEGLTAATSTISRNQDQLRALKAGEEKLSDRIIGKPTKNPSYQISEYDMVEHFNGKKLEKNGVYSLNDETSSESLALIMICNATQFDGSKKLFYFFLTHVEEEVEYRADELRCINNIDWERLTVVEDGKVPKTCSTYDKEFGQELIEDHMHRMGIRRQHSATTSTTNSRNQDQLRDLKAGEEKLSDRIIGKPTETLTYRIAEYDMVEHIKGKKLKKNSVYSLDETSSELLALIMICNVTQFDGSKKLHYFFLKDMDAPESQDQTPKLKVISAIDWEKLDPQDDDGCVIDVADYTKNLGVNLLERHMKKVGIRKVSLIRTKDQKMKFLEENLTEEMKTCLKGIMKKKTPKGKKASIDLQSIQRLIGNIIS